MVKWWWCLSTVTLSVYVLSGIIRVKAERRSRRPKEFPDSNKNLPNFPSRSTGARPISTTKNVSRLLDNLLKGYDQKLRPSFGGKTPCGFHDGVGVAYTTREVVYKWNVERQVVIASDLILSQFDLIAVPSGMENITRRAGEFSTLLASFYLQRHMGNFLIQVYGPCMLLVVLSWVSFWLNREATSDRISLGITTVLTMTFLGLEARKDLPKVSYSTALDLFVWLSYGFIFATIIEFAFVHIFTKVGSGEVYLSESSSEADSDDEPDEEEEEAEANEEEEEGDEEEDEEEEPQTEPIGACTLASLTAHHSCPNQTGGPNGVGNDSLPLHVPLPSTLPWTSSSPHPSIPSWTPPPPCAVRHWGHIPPCPSPPQPTFFIRLATFCSRRRRRFRCSTSRRKRPSQESMNPINQRPRRRRRRRGTSAASNRRSNRQQQMNSVSNIDEISRVLFPLCFLCINLIYWYIYLSTSPWPEDHF
ncbi:gamma-aminobutyric acid receptor alpha-like [Palaemon carinicauda]|uniref:gamma-aminobutyric acid receptor alpha-like n=1 Tax=Palaemon carinicauda TaxID=392227 RepID=UPI0035B592F6